MIFNTLTISFLCTFITKMTFLCKHVFISHSGDARKASTHMGVVGYSLLNYLRRALGGRRLAVIIPHGLQGI